MKFVRTFPPTSPIAQLQVELDGDAVVVTLAPRQTDGHAASVSHDFPFAGEPAFRAAIVRWFAGQASRTHFDAATVESIADQIVGEFDSLLPEE